MIMCIKWKNIENEADTAGVFLKFQTLPNCFSSAFI